jgi:methionine-rich copper-binding protein CopC
MTFDRTHILPISPETSAFSARAERAGRRRGRALVLLAVMFLTALLLGLLQAQSASAHDAVESTTPADGETVAVMPSEITLTLDNTPGTLGSAISVKDAAGTNWADGQLTVLDHVVSQPIRAGAPAGTYTVLWRVVSSDSHPIDGSFSFTASGAAGTGAATSALGTPVPLETPAPATGSSAQGFPWSVLIIGVVLVALLVGIALVVRRRLGRDG